MKKRILDFLIKIGKKCKPLTYPVMIVVIAFLTIYHAIRNLFIKENKWKSLVTGAICLVAVVGAVLVLPSLADEMTGESQTETVSEEELEPTMTPDVTVEPVVTEEPEEKQDSEETESAEETTKPEEEKKDEEKATDEPQATEEPQYQSAAKQDESDNLPKEEKKAIKKKREAAPVQLEKPTCQVVEQPVGPYTYPMDSTIKVKVEVTPPAGAGYECQWYVSKTANGTGEALVGNGAKTTTYSIPKDTGAGDYYFYCMVKSVDNNQYDLDSEEVRSDDVVVTIQKGEPQLSDFDKELQDYKAHVESEIAQEAEAAGMTVEEYAANSYEPQEQPADVQEQPEETLPADTAPEQAAVRYYTINEGAARRANDANSYRDYAAGSATAEYRQMVDQAAAIAQRQKERVDPMYHEKIDALLDTYARKLAENLNDHYAIEARVPSILVAGGSNFPVRKKEKQNAARDRNMQEWQDVQRILDKIRSTGMGGISMDDPQAAAKLEAKLVKLESAQETMKAVNAYFRKNKTLEGCPSLTQEQITKLQQEMAQSWHLDKSRPYPAYMLSNNNAEIRRIRGRIEQVRQHEETNFAGWEFDGGRVEANKADNRLQVFFDGKPDEAARDELKANGFRWAPSVGAWQRQLNKNAYYAAGYISCIQPISGEKPIDVQRSAQQQESAAPDAHLTGDRVSTPRGSFHVADMTREQMEAAGYGYHHSTDDGKYLIMGNGTQAFAITAEQREQENYMRTAELSTEQNYNMIDGQINNTPSVDELEEKAKRGEVISLSALAAAVKAEDGRTPQRDPDGKKPSIRAQLKADRAQSCKPQQREKEQEAKRSIRQALEME